MLVAVPQRHKVPGARAFQKMPHFVRLTVKLQELVILQYIFKIKVIEVHGR